jgi:creatinine amidohydrolase
MLAIAPQQVRPELCAGADDEDRTGGCVFSHPVNRTSLNGVTGAPSRASADKGRIGFDWLVEDLSALIRKGLAETPPLPTAYDWHFSDDT